MEKRFVTDEEFAEHKTRCIAVPKGESVKYSISKLDPVYFMVNQLGVKPFVWQAEMLDYLTKGKNVLACTSRQIGKTLTLAVFALWSCTHNTLPLPSSKKTRIVFVSKTEGQALKVISDVRELMRLGDDRVFELTGGKVEKFFTNKIAKGENTTNSKSTISFENGCQIISLPPTDAARGYTGSQLFIDEVAFIPDDVITNVLLPIVAATGYRVSCTSTPNGRQGWFYKNFDPEDGLPDHPFVRMWCPYDVIRQDDPDRCERLDKEHQLRIRQGEERSFLQEYEASFEASASSFFSEEQINNCIDDRLEMVQESPLECDAGIDFGVLNSRTVITLTTLVKQKDKEPFIRVLWQYEYGENKGVGQDLVDDFTVLMKKYKIQRIVAEQCPASTYFMQAAKNKGWPLTEFVPAADKDRQYHKLRAWMAQSLVKMPNITELVKQMRGLCIVQLPTKARIEHGSGLRDDCIDSLMMATFHQTEDKGKLRVLV
jgi:hypothetical protein